MILAAMARHLKARLLTTDGDFQALADIQIENWLS
jgi:predicted nucleic acid-binding protein